MDDLSEVRVELRADEILAEHEPLGPNEPPRRAPLDRALSARARDRTTSL